MFELLFSLLQSLTFCVRSRARMEIEILALRHQLSVLRRSVHRPRLRPTDRWLWVVLARLWSNWRSALIIVKPETVLGWHRQGFRLYWTWKSRHRPGRPNVTAEIQQLIRTMSAQTRFWALRESTANY